MAQNIKAVEKTEMLTPEEKGVPNTKPAEENVSIAKPGGFDLNKFKSKLAATVANVETLTAALPVHNMAAARDLVRLHPNEAEYWSDELCFVRRSDQRTEAQHAAPDRRGPGA